VKYRLPFLKICCLTALIVPATDAIAATVTGSIRLMDSQDPNVRRRGDYSGVVVWLEFAGGPAPAVKPQSVRILQKQKQFVPHIVAIPVGSTVHFPNLDPIFHNAFSNFSGQPFDVGLYPPGTSQSVRFAREGAVRVFCNIHSAMSAVIVVVPTSYIAISAKTGQFSIDGVEPGQYRLRVYHERSSDETLQKLERKITVDQATFDVGTIIVSESGHIEIPHKNKYGQDYPPVVEDRATYPGRNP
jgi:plastocyanin